MAWLIYPVACTYISLRSNWMRKQLPVVWLKRELMCKICKKKMQETKNFHRAKNAIFATCTFPPACGLPACLSVCDVSLMQLVGKLHCTLSYPANPNPSPSHPGAILIPMARQQAVCGKSAQHTPLCRAANAAPSPCPDGPDGCGAVAYIGGRRGGQRERERWVGCNRSRLEAERSEGH